MSENRFKSPFSNLTIYRTWNKKKWGIKKKIIGKIYLRGIKGSYTFNFNEKMMKIQNKK